MTSPTYTCAHGGEPTEVDTNDIRAVNVFKGEWAEILREMMFDFRTTDPEVVVENAILLLNEMRKRGKWIYRDEQGHNKEYPYGKRYDKGIDS